MSTYALPEMTLPEPVKSDTVLLVASGDLRESANQNCWPAQQKMEEEVIAAFAKEGVTVQRAHPYDPERKHGFISSQRMGMEVFKNIHPGCAAHRRRGRLAVQPPRAGRAARPSRADPDRRQLVRRVAGPGGYAEPEWPLTKAGVAYSSIWSEDFTDEFFLQAASGSGSKTGRIDHDTSHVRDLNPAAAARAGSRTGPSAGRAAARRKGDHGHLRRGLHGHVQRHHRRRAAESDGHLQGAAQPVGAGRRDAAGHRRGGPGGPPLARRRGHAVHHRSRTRPPT